MNDLLFVIGFAIPFLVVLLAVWLWLRLGRGWRPPATSPPPDPPPTPPRGYGSQPPESVQKPTELPPTPPQHGVLKMDERFVNLDTPRPQPAQRENMDTATKDLAAAERVIRTCPATVEKVVEAIHYAGGLSCLGLGLPMVVPKALAQARRIQLNAELDRLNKGPRADAPT